MVARTCIQRLLLTGMAFALAAYGAGSLADVAGAQGCPNEQIRQEEPYAAALPDCRAYEQVTPVNKNFAGPQGSIESIRSAPSGEAVTFDSLVAFPPGEGAYSEGSTQLFVQSMSARGLEGWSAHSLEPAAGPDGVTDAIGVTEDLAHTFVFSDNLPPLVAEPGAVESRNAVYIRDNQTDSYRLLFQTQPEEEASFFLVGAGAADSRIFFESGNRLLPEAEYGSQPRTVEFCFNVGAQHYCKTLPTPNLYEWHEGQLRLVDLLPGGALPSAGGVAGLDGVSAHEDNSGNSSRYFVQNVVSEDGSRVFFTDRATGALYARESPAGGVGETTAVSREPGEGGTPAAWQAATPNGSRVFYEEGGGLYRFDVGARRREALTGGSAGLLGVLGVSNDGSYVYFAASGVLAHGAVPGAGNIYVWHEGSISLVSAESEAPDWAAHQVISEGHNLQDMDEGDRTSRVSADGRTLMFTSGAVAHGAEPPTGGKVYVYDAASGRVACVSCNPNGAPVTTGALLYDREGHGNTQQPPLYPQDLPRNLSEDGSRVFFETEEALLPADANGAMNVYEWEREGAGSCPTGRGGCLYLISTGNNSQPSYFAEAGASGRDLFFWTEQPLVGQDNDELVDLYDAREGGGIAAQNPPSCRTAPSTAPALGLPTSQVFSGPGNPALEVEAKPVTASKPKSLKCKTGFMKKHDKCVKKPKPKKKAHKLDRGVG
jgi:hypothetical protein